MDKKRVCEFIAKTDWEEFFPFSLVAFFGFGLISVFLAILSDYYPIFNFITLVFVVLLGLSLVGLFLVLALMVLGDNTLWRDWLRSKIEQYNTPEIPELTLPGAYPYVIELREMPTEEGGGWLATVPALDGCISDGDTPNEAVKNVMDAVVCWKEVQEQRGDDMPEPDNNW